jgi:hypothetical protein
VLAAATIAGVGPADGEGLDWLEGMGDENVAEFEAVRAGPDALEEFITRWAPDLRTVTGGQILAELGDLVSPPYRAPPAPASAGSRSTDHRRDVRSYSAADGRDGRLGEPTFSVTVT